MSDQGLRPEPPTDDAIRAMIEARAARSGRVRFDVDRIVAEARQRAHAAPGAPRLVPRFAIAAATFAAAVILTAVVAIPITNRPAASGPASADPSPQPSPLAPVAAEPRILLPAELGQLMMSRAGELNGTIVAVTGTLEADPGIRCRAPVCAVQLADAGGVLVGRSRIDIGPGPWDGSGPKTGTFVLRITTAVSGVRPVVEYIGDLVHRDNGSLALSVGDIVGGAVRIEDAYAAVRGWLVRTPLDPCPTRAPLPSGVFFGGGLRLRCRDADYLTPSAWQPLQPDGSSIETEDAVRLPAGIYDRWAPDPAPFGPNDLGVEPRLATFLMQLSMDSTGPDGIDLVDGPHLTWHLVGRFDPIPDVSQDPTTIPSAETSDVIQPQSGTSWSVPDLMSRPMQPGEYVVGAWLGASATPARCAMPMPVPSGSPKYSCGQVDWLADEAFRSAPSFEVPAVAIEVQFGAYDTFAISPSWDQLQGEPRWAIYLVRELVRSSCDFVTPTRSGTPCLGKPVLAWEVLDRLP